MSLDFQRTVLHLCAEFANDSITDLLLTKGIPSRVGLSPIDALGNTPLHICAQKNNIHMWKELLRATESSSNGSTAISEMLETRNNNGFTAFHDAIENTNSRIVKLMMEKVRYRYVLIEDTNEQLRTSLHIAAWNGKTRIGVLW